jgi:hypothetical protein
MKTPLFLVALLFSFFAFGQYTAIPDPNFEAALSAYDDIPNDGKVPTANISMIISLSVNGKGISDLTGIEAFTALESLDCYENQLSTLDVSQNIALKSLICHTNQLTDLDVSQNTNLFRLDCSFNELTTLNVQNGNNVNFSLFNATNNLNLNCIQVDDPAYSTANWTNIDLQTQFSHNCGNPETYVPDNNFENYLETHDANGNTVSVGDTNSMGNGVANDNYVFTSIINTVTHLNVTYLGITDMTGIEDFVSLTVLDCDHNQLTNIDISQNISLLEFNVYYNQLTNLDLSNNTSLQILRCHENQLTNLNLSNNINLQALICAKNQITELNVSGNPNINYIWCQSNQLTLLKVQNGNNVNIPNINFNATNNPSLTCIFVDDAAWSTTNWTNIDATSHFVNNQTECNTLGVENFTFTNFSVFPNPTKQLLNITIALDATYKLLNIQGQTIKTGKFKNGANTLNTSNLSSGIYYLTIKTDEGIGIKKIVKQ